MAESSKYSFGSVEKVQIFEKIEGGYHEHSAAQSAEVSQALAAIKQLLQELQQQHASDDGAVVADVLDAELVTLEREDPGRRQAILDWLGVAFAGGVETVKLLFPPAGIPIEVGLKLHEVWQKRRSLPGE